MRRSYVVQNWMRDKARLSS